MLALAMTLSFTFFGCGAKEETSECEDYDTCSACCVEMPEDYEKLATTDKVAQTTVEYNGYSFSLYDEAQDIIDNLGEPVDKCEGEGFRYYTYDGFDAQYDEIDGKYILAYLLVNSSGIKTKDGLEVGSSADEVKTALGEPSNQYDCEGTEYMDYYYDEFSIFFSLEKDTVVNYTISRNCLSNE